MTEAPHPLDFLPPEGKKIDSAVLREIITDTFSPADLKILCHDLNWPYHELAGERHSERVLDLVQQFEGRQRLNVLYIEVRKQRPNANWSAIFVDITPEEEAGEHLPGPRRQSGDGAGETTMMLSRGLMALMKLMRSPEVNEAVAKFQADFETASSQIDRLNEYKLLHDLFQELEYHYALINTQQARLPDDELAWETIITSEPELSGKLTDVVELAQHSHFAEEGERWLVRLDSAKKIVRDAVEQEDDQALKKGLRQVYAVLSRQPTRLNTLLVAAADSLRLAALQEALQEIYGRISQSNVGTATELLEELQGGVQALNGLEEKVKGLVREHKGWQYIDDELRRLEGVGLDELDLIWDELHAASLDTLGDSKEEWAARFRELISNLDKAVTTGESAAFRKFHRRFRTQANRRFRRVDASLLALCRDLQRVGETIDLLLRSFK
ncbi:MAG: hypothetical protein D6835_05955 [Candidatus Thermofonsia bacterium]|nr:MAG: hypothetical protein D6835_05955 [Candidatus Thermofonsia bacterium]